MSHATYHIDVHNALPLVVWFPTDSCIINNNVHSTEWFFRLLKRICSQKNTLKQDCKDDEKKRLEVKCNVQPYTHMYNIALQNKTYHT